MFLDKYINLNKDNSNIMKSSSNFLEESFYDRFELNEAYNMVEESSVLMNHIDYCIKNKSIVLNEGVISTVISFFKKVFKKLAEWFMNFLRWIKKIIVDKLLGGIKKLWNKIFSKSNTYKKGEEAGRKEFEEKHKAEIEALNNAEALLKEIDKTDDPNKKLELFKKNIELRKKALNLVTTEERKKELKAEIEENEKIYRQMEKELKNPLSKTNIDKWLARVEKEHKEKMERAKEEKKKAEEALKKEAIKKETSNKKTNQVYIYYDWFRNDTLALLDYAKEDISENGDNFFKLLNIVNTDNEFEYEVRKDQLDNNSIDKMGFSGNFVEKKLLNRFELRHSNFIKKFISNINGSNLLTKDLAVSTDNFDDTEKQSSISRTIRRVLTNFSNTVDQLTDELTEQDILMAYTKNYIKILEYSDQELLDEVQNNEKDDDTSLKETLKLNMDISDEIVKKLEKIIPIYQSNLAKFNKNVEKIEKKYPDDLSSKTLNNYLFSSVFQCKVKYTKLHITILSSLEKLFSNLLINNQKILMKLDSSLN